jgi:ABC-type bacteriocin/lantibiotic exporter with double-glycine peptidase domain
MPFMVATTIKWLLLPIATFVVLMCILTRPNSTEDNHPVDSNPVSDPGNARLWRTPASCGVNSLFVLLRLSDIPVIYENLSARLPLTEFGSNMLDMKRAAATFGCNARVLRLAPDDLDRLSDPVVAHLELGDGRAGHYVVITRVGQDVIEVIDGTYGTLDFWNRRDFCRYWHGYVLVVQPTKAAEFEIAVIGMSGLFAALSVTLLFLSQRGRQLGRISG